MKPNVLSKFAGLSVEEVKNSIVRYPVALGAFTVQYDINVGVMIRNSNAFACQNFVMVGKKKFDRRPSLGTHLYENIVHLENTDALLKWLELEKYTLVGVDHVDGFSIPINHITSYPEKTLFLMGSERFGLSNEIIDACHLIVHINQYGSVRSLNVGVASGIILNDWHSKYNG